MAASGSTLSDIYASSQRLRLELTSDIERLEQIEGASTSAQSSYGGHGGGVAYGGAQWTSELQIASPRGTSATHQMTSELVHSMQLKLGSLNRMCSDMEGLWRTHHSKPQRELWRRKVEHLSEEAEALRQALDKFVGREVRREREAQERTELLRARKGGGGGEDIITEVERDRRDLDSAKRSNAMLEQTLAQGLATLAHMAQNREMLKGAQRRALDVLNYVGLSDKLLKKLSRREYQDKIIAYGGMCAMVFIFFGVWWWARS